jgi:hypothetical protein
LNVAGDAVNRLGIISGTNDVDFYVFTVGAGVVSINADPDPYSPNLDMLLELQNSVGNVVASANPDTDLNATVRYTAAAGTYYLKVQGTGRGEVLGNGYSSYGSIGHYSLSGGVNLVPPTISTQPLSRTVNGGANVTFSVSASGSPPLSYQWRRDGVSLSGATNASYTITNVQSSHTGDYTVEVSNGGGYFTDRLSQHLKLSREQAESFKITAVSEKAVGVDLESALRPISEELAEEIRRTISLYGAVPSDDNDGLKAIYLSGGGARLTGLRAMLEERMSVPVKLSEPFKAFNVGRRIDRNYLAENAPVYAVATGLSIRRPGDK